MTNKAIARVLNETATLLELTGANPFRARAFQNAARTVERMDESVTALLKAGTLTEVRGIGSGLAAQIADLIATGSFALYDELLDTLPAGLLDVLRVKGLGTKRVRQLWQERGITTLNALEAAAEAGHLADLDGFGPKTQANILANLQQLRLYRNRRHYPIAHALALPLLDALRNQPGIARAELAGTLRRKLETVDAVKLLVDASTEAVSDALRAMAIEPTTNGTVGGILDGGLPLVIHRATEEAFGTAWWRHTGSAAHCATFVERYGEPDAHTDEAAVYTKAGLPFIVPELREGLGELDAAAADALPSLTTLHDLRGTLHNHSTYSDGANTLQEMAEAARARGYEYFGICDHSQSLQIAHGMSIATVREQQAEIRRLNEAFANDTGKSFRILSGIECDILNDGSLDYPDDVLASFDFVVASIHTRFNMTENEATERLIHAVENPYTTILGHPTGRLLLIREGYPIDHGSVIAACAAHRVAIEINADPYRLDLDWRWIREATSKGVSIAINPDAHSTEALDNMQWGIAIARKGWLTPSQCLNAKSLDGFLTWLAARHLSDSA